MTRALLVDDDPSLRLALSKALQRKGVDVVDVASGEAAIEPLKTGISSAGPVDVCVLDLRMPGMSGLEVLRRTLGRKVPVVVLTGHGTVPDAVEAMRLGAVNFVQKPVDADELIPILKQAQRTEPAAVADAMLGASAVMLAFLEKLDRAARADEPVLLTGENGTGKELSARRLHDVGPHKRGPFVAMNAAALPRDLVESELFGNKRGAFAGAAEAKDGFMHKAAEGTLFIDDVGELPLDVQAKLLRAIEEKRFRPVGADGDRPFKGRIIAASAKDLKSAVEQGRFKAELFYKLSGVPLNLPPLRERGDDVVLIARAWLGRAYVSRPAGREGIELSFTPAAEERLRSYPWPGNVRELVNIVKRAALFARGDIVDDELVGELLDDSPFAHGAELPPSSSMAQSSSSTSPSSEGTGASGQGPRAGQRVTLEELEKTHIRRLLDELHNVSEVARIVGIDRRTLQRKMIAWGFRDPKPNDDDT